MGYALAAYIGVGLGLSAILADIILNGAPKSMRRALGAVEADEVDAGANDIRAIATGSPRSFALLVLLLGATVVGWPALLPFFLRNRR